MNPRLFPIHPTAPAVGVAVIVSLFAFAGDLLTSAASAADPESIAWRAEYNSAYLEAKAAKRLLWVQFTGPWCPNCKRMERDSFPQPQIVKQSRESLVPVKLRSDENEDLATRFNLTGLPATLVIDPETQKVLAFHQGYLGPDELDGVFREATALHEVRRRQSIMTRLASVIRARKDRLYAALRSTFSRLQEQGVGTELGVANLPVVLLASAMEVGTPPRTAEPDREQDKHPVALSGYCPVSLVDSHRLVLGSSVSSLVHEGTLYRFTDDSKRRAFQDNPGRYVPVNRGRCPVSGVDRAEVVAGDPHFGVVCRERLYLCASREDRGRFLQNPERYAFAHVEKKGFCPHCSQKDGLLVQGDPRFGLIRSGREYWFPDAEHRSAFLASLATERKSTRR
jgi:hypothetical protein